jgi:folate-dependent phosphoribosylglycinamide formyltransferase PurN
MLTPHHPLRVAVLCSHRAPGLLYLLNQSPDRGFVYEVVCCLTTEPTFAEEVRVERRGIPTLSHPIEDFYARRGADTRDRDVRAEYDRQTLKMIEPFLPDVILLDGYLYLVTEPMLARFRNRVINLHFADLALRTPSGAPQFPGIRAVRHALAAGQPETRATVHLVDAEPDAGPPIVRSYPFPVSPLVADLRRSDALDVFKAYAYAHEQWMLRTVAGPLMAAALRLIAGGAVELDAMSARADVVTPWLLERNEHLLAPAVETTLAAAGVM